MFEFFNSRLIDPLYGVCALPAYAAAVWGFAASFAFCVLLVLTKRWHGPFTMDHMEGVQKFHTFPTPRIGGVSIFMSLMIAWGKVPEDVNAIIGPIFIAGLPAFIFGTLEDITKRISVSQRLLATIASGLLGWWITGYSLTRVDIWGIDWLFGFTLVSVLFTAFAVAGVANSINIIDGLNGLASAMTTLAFVGFAMIAWQVGDLPLAGAAIVLAACVWGFFWVNWSFGKLFLGDGGSYFVGFALAWVAVLLIERNPSVSAFAALVICAHPVTEVLFSVYRRNFKNQHPGHPDGLHLHSLLKRRYIRRWFSSLTNTTRNSIAGFFMSTVTIAAVIIANLNFDSTWISFVCYFLFFVGYFWIYRRIAIFRWL